MMTRLRYPKGFQFFDDNGQPLALGRLVYYKAGTTAVQDTYSDAGGSIPNTNPVLLDGSGRLSADIYLGAASDYKELLQNASGAAISPWPDDNIPSAAAEGGNMIGDFTGASSGTGGVHGLVPAPAPGDQAKFLRGDASWAVPASGGAADITVSRTETKVTVASSSGASADIVAADRLNAGVMTAADRTTLNSLGTASTKNIPSSGNAASGDVVIGSDTRLTDARTPTAHASSHGSAGADPISIAASQVSGIPAALASQNIDNVSRLGIGTTDSGNALSVSGSSSLFSNSAGSIRVNYNKKSQGDTASFSFQDNFTTHAEMGLLGNDSFTLQVSPDGGTFKQAMVVDPSTGAVTFPNSSFGGGGGNISSFSFRDPNISGFSGAKWDFLQVAGTSNDISGTVSHHTFPMASGEVQLVRIDWIMALPDFSKTAAGQASMAFKKVGNFVSNLNQGTGVLGDTLRDNSNQLLGLALKLLSAGAFDINITSDNSSNTYNWFANVRILHMMTNS
jgi:hypothetical protein